MKNLKLRNRINYLNEENKCQYQINELISNSKFEI